MPTAKHKLISEIENRYCLQCRYALRGLSEHRCPECGKRFDPDDPDTTAATHRRGFADLAPETTPATLTMILAVGAALVFYQAIPNSSHHWLHGTPVSVSLIWTAITVFLYATCADHRPFGWPTRIGFISAVGFIFAMVVFETTTLLPFYVWQLLPLACCPGLMAASVVYALRVRSTHPISILLLTIALVAWLFIALVLAVISIHYNANPFDYWTYWFWTPQRW